MERKSFIRSLLTLAVAPKLIAELNIPTAATTTFDTWTRFSDDNIYYFDGKGNYTGVRLTIVYDNNSLTDADLISLAKSHNLKQLNQ